MSDTIKVLRALTKLRHDGIDHLELRNAVTQFRQEGNNIPFYVETLRVLAEEMAKIEATHSKAVSDFITSQIEKRGSDA